MWLKSQETADLVTFTAKIFKVQINVQINESNFKHWLTALFHVLPSKTAVNLIVFSIGERRNS